MQQILNLQCRLHSCDSHPEMSVPAGFLGSGYFSESKIMPGFGAFSQNSVQLDKIPHLPG